MEQSAAIYELDTQRDVEVKTMAIPEKAKSIAVVDNESMEMANGLLLDIKALRKEVETTFKPLAQKAFEAHKAIKAQWDKAEAPLKEGETILKSSIRKYMDEIERLRREEERRLQEIARKQEEERRLAEALLAEAEGNREEAEAILDEPIITPTVVIKADIPKVDNRMFTKRYKAQVFDLPALLKYAVSTQQYDLVLANETALNARARALKESFHIPGVKLIVE